MGKELTEKQKAIDEQWKTQGPIKAGQDITETAYGRALTSPGPDWLDSYNDAVNPDILAGLIMDEMGLYRRSSGIYDRNGQRLTDADLVEAAIAKIMPYLPEKAASIARFSVLPALQNRLKKLPLEATETANNSIGQYISSGRMQEEIEAFIKASDIKTNFYQFDKLAGGLFPGLYVIGAISSLGKTTFVQQLADNVAAAGKPVLFFSLEMSRLEMASKSISRKTAQLDYSNAVSSLKIRAGVKSRIVEQATEAYTAAVGDKLHVVVFVAILFFSFHY